MATIPCATSSCTQQASLRCPTCVSAEVTPVSVSYFCSQECFKSSWKSHKSVHKTAETPPRGLQPSSAARARTFDRFQYTGPLRVAEVIMPLRKIPPGIDRPDYADHRRGIPVSEEKFNGSSINLTILDDEGIAGMRKACRLAREVLDIAVRAAIPGVSTEEIDVIVHNACIERECYPSPLNYYGFPKSCCTSVNEVICHGIPDCRPLEDGDILNIDITVYHKGYHGDLNETVLIGSSVDEASKKLVRSAHDAMWTAIRMVMPGVMFREFGGAIEKVARARGHSVVRSYCGHGIGRLFHTAPNVPHYRKNKAVGVVREGMTFTIEPMLCANGWKDVTWPDNWTAVTEDGSRSAQFEHTILVTSTGFEVLTDRVDSGPKFWWEQDGKS